ncbi:ER lumen protein-retaining receptor-like isoform X3 [Hylaeus volcanicus]|uniref:ER lumen protein-retaining receptor-like isoform X3 n=1 Tax=Hylaeus volcanicus TaxID=313075 RepID=UPI0023B8534D|nr:ER lumen protein-retaining receptor-like isoform X3 [Hylaeus volcanicus]XP_053993345.1 ER lumen protein-retaining receptor-like isoform X3 [Hylaeus volcanicus]
MNIFRFIGDLLHVLITLLLLWKLKKSKNCIGISCRMQEVYLIVFLTRYVDLFWSFVSIYNTCMKIILITTTAYLIYLMRFQAPTNQTYDRHADRFQYLYYLVIPSAILAVAWPSRYHLVDILWTFSIWLESGAILPQLVLLQQLREVENLTSHYVATMGLYRLFYVLNWIYRYKTEKFYHPVAWVAGAVQVALYLDFFYYYIISRLQGSKLVLPVVNTGI